MICHVPDREDVGLVRVAGGFVVLGFGEFAAGGVDEFDIFGMTEAIAVWCDSDDRSWLILLVDVV